MKFSRTVIETAVSSTLVIVGTFVSGVLIARLLGPEARGAYGIIILATQIGFGFGTLSFFDALVIGSKKRRNVFRYASVAFWAGLGIVFISTLSGWGVFIALNGVAFPQLGMLALLIAGFMCVESVNRSLYSIELASGNYSNVNRERVIAVLCFSAIVVCLIVLGISSMLLLFLGFIVAKLPVFVLRLYRFWPHIGRRFSRPFFQRTAGTALRLHLPFSLSLCATQIDKIVIAGFFPATDFGFYLVAYSTVSIFFSVPMQIIGLLALPEFSGPDRAMVRMKFERTFRLLLVFSVCAVGVAVPLANLLIPWMFGTAFLPATAFALPVSLLTAAISIRMVLVELLRAFELWKVQAVLELTTIAFSLMAALAAGGSVTYFVYVLWVGFTVSLIACLALLAFHHKVISLSALVPSLSEIANLVRQR
ncbi:oligosaccharide flippase family protein [uncultured Erythrobacter sp.]|uniref:oligosaccharide flippase family protein n=1 Tax=uncultured Erythrobacter sp. TaxID=263913 RepID=UPI00265A6812|nr:oligosaccharide flippase family protein [uncultured Erythrobacter sp.]